jgi:hypothetical protein
MTHNEAIPLGPAERLGENFVRHALQRAKELVIAAALFTEFEEDWKGPTSIE